MCLVVIGGEISPEKEMAFLFRSRDSCTQCVLSPPNNIIVGFWSLKGIFKMWRQALHFLQSVESCRFIGWNVNTLFVSTRGTIHISNSLDVVHTQFFLSIFG